MNEYTATVRMDRRLSSLEQYNFCIDYSFLMVRTLVDDGLQPVDIRIDPVYDDEDANVRLVKFTVFYKGGNNDGL